jgi:hypothetical protein
MAPVRQIDPGLFLRHLNPEHLAHQAQEARCYAVGQFDPGLVLLHFDAEAFADPVQASQRLRPGGKFLTGCRTSTRTSALPMVRVALGRRTLAEIADHSGGPGLC